MPPGMQVRVDMRILVALDGSDGSFKALRRAIDLAQRVGAELHSVSIEEISRHDGAVLPMDDECEWGDSVFAPAIRTAQDNARQAGTTLHPHVIIGHEVKAVVQFIESSRFDLLVAGFVGQTAYSLHVMGGTAFGLVQHAPCPVLVVK